ncbi:protein of unknown function [Pseudodesulfovibrio profundus]|uniref:Uncharacterized protein n=1 Tax=Pseudodesulfovibrio profundus TaxID=57320 RepID=A0A2C8FBQ1_9BACT|nr:protein of unknown function [Pseudodesulfovibrio profundus]
MMDTVDHNQIVVLIVQDYRTWYSFNTMDSTYAQIKNIF